MAPPKKDAFADLFVTAAGASTSSSSSLNNKNLSLADRQKVQGTPPNNNSWSNLDVLSPAVSSKPGSIGSLSRSATPNAGSLPRQTPLDDPFDIFTQPAQKQAPIPVQVPAPQHPKPQSAGQQNGASLLDDDEFVDAFTPPPQPEVQPKQSASAASLDKKDTVLAELMDIGFSIEDSNRAISLVGPDLQACVNFIMGGGELKQSNKPAQRHQNPLDYPRQQDIGATINDLSSDFLSKASTFFNKSKKTVMKNIEQFQQAQGGGRSDSSGMPAWMREQQAYKKDATERKPNGGKFEDYGSDEENINHDEIQRFMELQRQKDKEKQKQRLDSFKEMARNKISGGANGSASGSASGPSLGRSSPVKASFPARSTRESPVQPPRTPAQTQPVHRKVSPPPPEVDLLGLGSQPLSRAEKFKSANKDDEVYVSSSRRRPASKPSKPRKTTSEELNQFLRSDYETSKEAAASFFANGDYEGAFTSYTKCLGSIPPSHELRIIINSNLAITAIKLGNYKQAKSYCDDGIDLVADDLTDTTWTIGGKPIKVWYVKLLSRKAESLEMLELFPEALECYLELISKHGANDKKIMDGKRRVNNIVNPPPKQAPRAKPVTALVLSSSSNEAVNRIRQHSKNEKLQEDMKFKLHDKIQGQLAGWSSGKEDNLRALLMSLTSILPASVTGNVKVLTINDLMLTKKVKINYLKAISTIHPDKLGNLSVEDQMVCQGVFIVLNKSWDAFKEQNGLN